MVMRSKLIIQMLINEPLLFRCSSEYGEDVLNAYVQMVRLAKSISHIQHLKIRLFMIPTLLKASSNSEGGDQKYEKDSWRPICL